tara:strand:- start:139 stop:831 length:693 start_codon:yes stop_codon:yes gene_type:complete
MIGNAEGSEAHGTAGYPPAWVSANLVALRLALLGGGSLVLILSSVLFLREMSDLDKGTVATTGISEIAWVVCWLVAVVLVGIYSMLLVMYGRRSDETPFPLGALKNILITFAVPMGIGGILGLLLVIFLTAAIGAALWVISFGTALLATRRRAPRSIARLGWVVISVGLTALFYSWSDGTHPLPLVGVPEHLESPMLEANLIMGVCFGLIPICYSVFFMKACGKLRNTHR